MNEGMFSRMLNLDDIKYLNTQNVEFGSHSHTHSILTMIDDEKIRYELSHSKKILEDILQKDVSVLAYPNGKYNAKIEQMAIDCGFSIALQTDDEANKIERIEEALNSFKRINQYHQNIDEALAHTYGITKILKKNEILIMANYEVRMLDAENLDDLNLLFSAAFKTEPKPGFLQWKYFDNPVGNAILVGIFFSDKLVAAGAMIPEKLVFKNDEIDIYSHTELMTDPDHQKKS